MKIPLKFVHTRGGTAIAGHGAIAQSRDGKPVAWLDTESRTVIFVNSECDEIPVESVAKMRRIAEVPVPAKK